ncbi:LysR family transcriptional regulator [Paracoccaceae bacterium GXU_MW_L88]
MDKLRQLKIFIQIMESGNFTKAAKALAMPRSTVSTELQALEDRLGCPLFHRSTRNVTPTADGYAFLDVAREVTDAVDSAEARFINSQTQLSGRLRVDMPSRIGRKIVIPALPDFLAAHPGLHLDLSTSDRPVDLVTDGVDCVLRLDSLRSSELICRKLADIPFVTCASRDYVNRYGNPASRAALTGHKLVNYATKFPAGEPSLTVLDNGAPCEIPMQSALTVDNAEAYIAAACAGLGLIQIPRFELDALLSGDTLIPVLSREKQPSIQLSMLYPTRRNMPAKVKVFQKWMEGVLGSVGVLSPVPIK